MVLNIILGMNMIYTAIVIYIITVFISLLGLYVDVRRTEWKKRKQHTLGDLFEEIPHEVVALTFMPLANTVTLLMAIWVFITPIWNIIKRIRIN